VNTFPLHLKYSILLISLIVKSSPEKLNIFSLKIKIFCCLKTKRDLVKKKIFFGD